MGDPSTPDEQEDIERLLSEDADDHGPGDLDNLPPSDLDEPDGTDAA